MKINNTFKILFSFLILFCWSNLMQAQDCSNDTEAPITACDNLIQLSASETEAIILTPELLNGNTTDNCTAFEDLQFLVRFYSADASIPDTESVSVEAGVTGVFLIEIWVIDESSNVSYCVVDVQIGDSSEACENDETSPVAICDSDIIILVNPTTVEISVDDVDDGSYDNCTFAPDLSLTLTTEFEPASPPTATTVTIEANGTTPVFLWVTDEAGNSNICATNVIFGQEPDCSPDVIAPVAVCNEVVNASTLPGLDFELTAEMLTNFGTDNCTALGDLQYFLSTEGNLSSPPNTETLVVPFDSEDLIVFTYVVDESGNFSSCATTVQFDILQGVVGKVFVDANGNCLLDAGEEGLEGFQVRYTLDQGLTYTNTFLPSNEQGNYNLTFNWDNSPGEITVELLMPDGLGNSCVTSHTYDLPFSETVILDFPVQLVTDCDYMYTDISAPFLRRCFPTPYTVSYCNYSTEAIDNVELTVTLDAAMDILEINSPYTDLGNNTLLFELGTVESGDCGLINIAVILDCNTTLGATKCVQSSISPNDCNEPGTNWSGASLVVNGECDEEAGKVNFTITNEGTGAMAEALEFIVVEDVVMYMHTPILLNPNDSEALEFDANGSTWRVAIEQEEGHPSLSSPTAFVEGCGGYGSTGMANQFAMDDVDPFIAIDCQEVIAAYDPNDKRAFPEGYSEQHFIEPNTSIEYNIRFQNTGTDTAFTVRIEDRLSTLLDETSIEAGASSHPYRMEVQEDGLLIFHFENIMLPDSNVNEVASHGFVQFRAQQKPDNQLGMMIENTAEIYFDFNEEIVTNTVFHTLGTNFIISETNEVFVPNLDLIVAPNPFHSKATFTLKGVDINNGTIELYDVFGRLIRQDSFSGNQYELKRENLPIGTYLFRFLDENKLLVNGKIIVN